MQVFAYSRRKGGKPATPSPREGTMYANLAVSIRCKRIDAPDTYPEEISAHAIEIRDGIAVVQLDANDGEASYAEPAGEQRIPLDTFDIDICADF
jgi:hypothetical protein